MHIYLFFIIFSSDDGRAMLFVSLE